MIRIIVMEELKDNEEMRRLNRELQEAKKRLEELNHFKSHLLSITSHQVRAPLGIIKGYARLIHEGTYGEASDKVKETAVKIGLAADSLIAFVTNVMDLRMIEEGKVGFWPERANLRELAEKAVEEFRSLAEDRGLELSFKCERAEVFVKCDLQKITHVIHNLVDNAIKYTQKGFIKCKLEADEKEAVFSVQDSGIGVKAGVAPLVFEEFMRDESVKKEIRGAGIGLHVAKTFVEAHKGKIWVESEGEGRGSKFSFSLPLADG